MSGALAGLLANYVSPVIFTLTDHAVDESDLTTYTFSTKSIGAGTADRYIIVGAGGQSAATRTLTCKVASVSATQVVTAEGSGGGAFCRTSLFIIPVVSAAATADIELTFSGPMVRASIGIWAATALQSSTATATYTSTANPGTASVACSSGGAIVGYSNVFDVGAVTTSWTGLTERFDETFVGACGSTGASNAFAAAQAGLTVTATPASFTAGTLVLAAFR